MLDYNGQGTAGGAPGDLGVLNLPTEVVSSEFLTMEGKKFSSSHGIVIYVRDMLSRYQADALRYFISAAGPETSDADFTWAEFVRRTNGELVAGWGNLVNRTASMIAKRFGEIPVSVEFEDIDRCDHRQQRGAEGDAHLWSRGPGAAREEVHAHPLPRARSGLGGVELCR